MALTLFSSNRVETLQSRLTRQLAANPLKDPFAAEVIVVPTYAMGRWLNLRIALELGIAANIRYPQPGEWVWQLAASLLEDLPPEDPYAAAPLVWQIFNRLPALTAQPAFSQLQSYLEDDDSGIKRWQLSQRIAASLDRYQSYRPQMIRAWSRGEDDHWQAILWREIIAANPAPGRLDTIAGLIEILGRKSGNAVLPERISLFALSSLSPLYLEVVQALAQRVELDLYLHCPTDQYWADLENEKRKSRRRLAHPELDELYETGNELLASWGRQGQVFQDSLLAGDILQAVDVDLFARPDDSSLLGKLQRSIFELDPNPCRAEADASITVQVCHSAQRECQVLLDSLLAMLERDGELSTEDILVMVPDIAAYAPYIEAVFQRQGLAFNISDITLADEHPLVMTFLQLLGLPHSRFTISEIMACLDNAALRRRFEIDADALYEIRRLAEQAHTRWGIDASHKTELDLPATDANTWQHTGDRFFAGFALAADTLWNGIAPLPGWNDSDADAIGRFWHFFERLRLWRKRLAQPRRAEEWQTLLLQMLDDFFVEPDARESRLQPIRNAICEACATPESMLTPDLMRYLMERALESREQSGQLYSGGITFCGMRPMRSIPFKVICLLGMNRNDFPRREPPSDFELISASPTAGDPSRRSEDRYLMLETLLCARDTLYISYTGRSLKDNSHCQPSALVQELLDFIDTRFQSDASRFSDELVRVQPMQAFSPNNFEAPAAGYNRYWCAVANRLSRRREPGQQSRSQQALDETEDLSRVELAQLRRFIGNPVQYFFRQRLGLYLERDEELEDDETFELSGLDQWRVKQQLAADALAQRDDGAERLYAEGLLAHGQAARAQLDRIRDQQQAWFEALAPYSGQQALELPVALDPGNEIHLGGSIGGYYPGAGLMNYQAGKLKGRHLLALWIDHLALCASGQWQTGEPSRLLTSDQTWHFERLEPGLALEQLADYCALYREGLRYPLPVFPETSFAWARASDRDKALEKALKDWHNRWSGVPGSDFADSYIQLARRGSEKPPFDTPGFDSCARRLYTRLLEYGVKS